MEIKANMNQAKSFRKTHIKRGFYKAKLVEVKEKQNEGKHGKKLVLLFDIMDPNLIKDGKFVRLATEAYWQYRNEDGTWRTALTRNSRLTQIFESLGWKFSEEGLNTEDFMGKEAEVLVDEYEYESFNADTGASEKLKASTIKDVRPLEEKV